MEKMAVCCIKIAVKVLFDFEIMRQILFENRSKFDTSDTDIKLCKCSKSVDNGFRRQI